MLTAEQKLELYQQALKVAKIELKGKNNPYTSTNGHMFSFFGKPNIVAVRLGKEAEKQFIDQHKTLHPVIQYNSKMHGYVEIPNKLLKNTQQTAKLLKQSLDYIKSLPPK